LEELLTPLAHYYQKEGIEELAINHEKEIWLRLRGKRKNPWVPLTDRKLSKEYLSSVMHVISNTYNLPFDPLKGSPVIFATLPGGHRFSGILGRNVMYDNNDLDGGVALSLRVFSESIDIKFEDFGLVQGQNLKKITLTKKELPKDPYERLMFIINSGEPLLISGATSTGKTTFLNNLLKLLNPEFRVITVEDSRELIVPQQNRVHIVLSRTEQTNTFDYKQVLDLIVRMTPDVILGGEVSSTNAAALNTFVDTGHKHFFTTIHADSPENAFEIFAKRIKMAGDSTDINDIIKDLEKKFHVVQIGREGNLRSITDII
jgi:type IV secretion system protein VirB11